LCLVDKREETLIQKAFSFLSDAEVIMAFPFEPNNQKFSLQNALGCALASQLAYSTRNAIDAKAKGDWGFVTVNHYTTPPGALDDTQAFVAVRSDMVLIAFRGTEPENIKDWLTDSNAVLVPSTLGHLHKGFLRAFNTVGPQIVNDLRSRPDTTGKPLWFTGHSLGAALSTIMTASCANAGLQIAGHYNFGSPRVGDSSFANFYNERCASVTFRFVNNNDIVPRVPPRQLLYDHVDFKRYFDRHCQLISDTRMIDLLLDSFEGSLIGLRKLFAQVAHLKQEKLPLPDFIEDHRIDNYISCIQKNLP
jgi:triacylglycerol lipase